MEKLSDYYCQYFIYHLDCLSVSFQRLQSNMSSINEINESHQNGFVRVIINNKENGADEPCNEEERLLNNQDIGHDHMPLWKAAVNFICDVEGTGLLALPYAVLHGGVATLTALVIVSAICCYTGIIMVQCLYGESSMSGEPKARLRSSIEELGEACWPGVGRKVVLALQNTELLMLSSSYLVLCGSFLDYAFPSLPLTKIVWSCIGAVVVLPTVFIKSLSNVAWLSLIGIVSVLVQVGSVLWYGISHSPAWQLNSIPLWTPEGIPVAFGIIIFSNAAHSILPRLEGDMSNKGNFNAMLGISYILITLIKLMFSLCGFLPFTTHTKDLVINNLPIGAVYYVTCVFLGINVLASYPFPVLIVARSIEDVIYPDSILARLPKNLSFICLRVSLTLFTLGMAILIPHFALMLALVGSMTSATMCFVLPCLFHLKLKRTELKLYHKILDYFIITFGLAAAGFGLVFSGKALVAAYETK